MVKKKKDKGIELILEDNKETSDKTITAQKPKQKSVLTLFLFLVPLLLMAYTQDFITKVALFFYEAVLLQNYINEKNQNKEI